MTSPLTERSKSVTSSGRSSTSTTIRWHSGLLVVIELAIDCMIIVLPALDGETIRPRWPLPIGAAMSMTRPIRLVGSVSRRSRSLRVERGQLGELDAALGRLGVGAVDAVDAHHRVELLLALALAGLAHLADDRVAAAQAELAHHRQRDVDVVGAGQVAAGADERVVVEDVEDAGGRAPARRPRGSWCRARCAGRHRCRPRSRSRSRPRRRRLRRLPLAVAGRWSLGPGRRRWSAGRGPGRWFWSPGSGRPGSGRGSGRRCCRPGPAGCRGPARGCRPWLWSPAAGRRWLWSPCWSWSLAGRRGRSPLLVAGRRGRVARRRSCWSLVLRRGCPAAARLARGSLPRGLVRRASCSARGSACSARPASAPLAAALGGLDRLDELGLLHGAGAGDAQAAGHRLEVGEQHGVESATALLRPGAVGASGGSGGGFDGFRHVRSFPRISADPA